VVAWGGVLLISHSARGQTFEVNGASNNSNKSDQKQQSTSQGLGWGSSIDVARQARAADDALRKGDYGAATNYAQKAAESAPQNTELWFLLGYSARLAERYQVSVDAYKKGLERQPNSIQGLSGLAQTYAKMGRIDEAEKLLDRVVAANPKDAASAQLAGELLLNSDPKRALDYLKRSDQAQGSARTEVLISRAYERLHQPEEAAQYLERARTKAPHDPEVLRSIAGEYRESGKYDLAVSTLESIPNKTPDLLAELAYSYELAGTKEKAAALYSRLATEASGNLSLQLSAAQALANLGQFEEARKFLAKAQKTDANHYRLHAILAEIAKSQGDSRDAIDEYKKAIASLPPTPTEGPLYAAQLRFNLYDLYKQVGDDANAEQQLNDASAALANAQVPSPSQPEFLRLRASVEAASGDAESASRDLQEALRLAPTSTNVLLSYGGFLEKQGKTDEAKAVFAKVLQLDPRSRYALTSLGYLAREVGDNQAAEDYFKKVVELFPNDYAPKLALGDLYASIRKLPEAEASYEAAYKLMPGNPLIISGGANAALEAHDQKLAQAWVDRATGATANHPQVMRERERLLTLQGHYEESAVLGYKVIEQLPRDKEAPVYLAYDLYYLNRYDEAQKIIAQYSPVMPRNKDFALISGYIAVHDKRLPDALADFTRALEADPQMSTGYGNRGYVLNDLREPTKAVQDFKKALELRPDYGEAHLGLGFAYLQLHRPTEAAQQLGQAETLLGQSHTLHLAWAETFRQEQQYAKAEREYRAALAETPNDLTTLMAMAEVQYRQHHYSDSIESMNAALKLDPDNPTVLSLMARAYGSEGQREEAMRYIELAEQKGGNQADVLMNTGDVLLELGDKDAAMQRFSRALDAPDADPLSVRLAIARVFVEQGKWEDAYRQVGLGFAEARVNENSPVAPDDFVAAANILLAIHEFDLAQTYFEKARTAGVSDRVVAVGLANTYLAQGKTDAAAAELQSVGNSADDRGDYAYMMAWANVYRQRQDTTHALTAFARANSLATETQLDLTQNAQYEVAGEEGRQINQKLSLLTVASFAPFFEDINIYTLDAKLLGVTNPALLPPPRSNFQSLGEAQYRVHLNGLPTISGFAGESLTSGTFFFPSTGVVQDRHTFDTMFNGGVNPVLHFHGATFNINTGLQFTIRRDTLSPVGMNQNLFRQYLYLSTNSLFNWVTIRGSAIHESGPFTEQNLSSRDFSANLEFTVGRPWGNTALIAGYGVRDLLFHPFDREYYSTSTYAGIQRRFGQRWTVTVLAEYLRSWRVENNLYGIAQALLPGGRFDFKANARWRVEGAFTLSRGEGFHAYDNAQSEFLVTYVRGVRGSVQDGTDTVSVSYPARFSFGVAQQTFYNFNGSSQTTLLPVVRLTLF